MSETATGQQTPIVIDRVERGRGDGDHVRLRLAGRRLVAADAAELDVLLIVQAHGRRHRFAATGDEPPESEPGAFAASFTVPDWAVPAEQGQASVWVGSTSVPMPPVGTKPRPASPERDAVTAAPSIRPDVRPSAIGPIRATGAPAQPAGVGSPAGEPPATVSGPIAAGDSGRAGPLAQVLSREKLAALQDELDRRAAEQAQLRGALEGARSDLAARIAAQAELESTHEQLRAQLSELVDAVAAQQAEFERRLERARADHEQELAEVRASAEQELASAREAARERVVAVRAEADEELAAARAQQAGYVQAREQLAVTSERLAGAIASEQARAQEAAALREQLAAMQVSRDAAISEAGGLRAELQRIGSELAVAREAAATGGADLGAAQQLLDDARALTARLRAGEPS